MKQKNKKIIVILGPTATGKTKLAVKLAMKYSGEIISADSRQVYQGMDIGTGKDLKDYQIGRQHVPYYLIDIVSPKSEFNVAKYQKLAYQAIDDILARDKIPFLVGGTGLYIDAITKGYVFGTPNAKPAYRTGRPAYRQTSAKTPNIRQKLDNLSLKQLLIKLKKIDLATYKIIDQKNRRRVQRALEIFYETGSPKSQQILNQNPDFDVLFIGLIPVKYDSSNKIFTKNKTNPSKQPHLNLIELNGTRISMDVIYQKIDKRLKTRIDEGMVKEIKTLRKKGVSWKRLDDFGLEYRYVSRYLRGKIDDQEMMDQLKNAICHFAKRQLTWFKRNQDIIWVSNLSEADKLIKKFLK